MKRLMILAAMLLFGPAIQFLAGCSSPLESADLDDIKPGPGPLPETVFVVDTTFIQDTLVVVDTNNVIDTVFQIDTAYVYDTLLVIDTLYQGDTILVIDTVVQTDSIITYDTTYFWDTLFVIDTVVQTDSIITVDTTIMWDTVTVTDTTWLTDTITVIDSTMLVDMLCARMGSSQQQVVWLFRNDPGLYRLEFAAATDFLHPNAVLVVAIGDDIYSWDLSESRQFDLDKLLAEDAVITITKNKPSAFGHEIDICVTVTRLP